MIPTESRIYFAVKTEDTLITKEVFDSHFKITPDEFEYLFSRGDVPKCTCWQIGEECSGAPDVTLMINSVVDRIKDIKNKLVSFKEKYPDVVYSLNIVLCHGENAEGFFLDPEILLVLGEIGAGVDVDQYNYS